MTKDVEIIQPDNPQGVAEQFKAAEFPTLLNHQDEWLAWDGSAYQPLEAATVESRVAEFLQRAKVRVFVKGKAELIAFKPKSKDIGEVYSALKRACHVPINTMSPPVWLRDAPEEYAALAPKNLISFQNGLLDIDTRTLYPATPFFFTRTALAITYDADAPAPEQWLKFLDEVMKGRRPLIGILQEWMGYKISSDTSMQKICFLWGRTRAGKGTILNIEAELVGRRNVAFPKIETLAGRFGLQGLISKSSAQVTDMNCEDQKQLSAAATNLNGISGEDGQTIERKGITDWNGKLGTRFTLAGNTLPNFRSHTGAMATRLIIVPFDVSFVGREDRTLDVKLKAELPGILNWALDGLERLRMCGDFSEPEDCRIAKHRLIYQSDPVHGFIEERCTLEPVAGIDKAVAYAAFVRYCEQMNARVPPMNTFSERLMQSFPTIADGKRNGDDGRVPCYRGVRLNDAEAVKVYKLDPVASDLALDGFGALLLDAHGWPVINRAYEFSE
jgi:putative DNA primase/helicase